MMSSDKGMTNENNARGVVWMEIISSNSETPAGKSNPIEIHNTENEKGENPVCLIDKIERQGNLFMFETRFKNNNSIEPDYADNSIRILCGNLSQSPNESNSNILFHIDYWQKRISGRTK